MNSILYVVGYCPVCDTGPLGVRCCGGCDAVWVVCEECEAYWADPAETRSRQYLTQPDAPCPRCGTSLWQPNAHWATYDELNSLGWTDKIVAQGTSLRPSAEPHSDRGPSRRSWSLPGIDIEPRDAIDDDLGDLGSDSDGDPETGRSHERF